MTGTLARASRCSRDCIEDEEEGGELSERVTVLREGTGAGAGVGFGTCAGEDASAGAGAGDGDGSITTMPVVELFCWAGISLFDRCVVC